jgi:hypothetical protein
VISWDGPRIGLLSVGRLRQHVSLLDPATGAVTPVLSSRRWLGLYGTSPSGALRLVAAGDDRHPLEAWLVLPDGRRTVRPLPQLENRRRERRLRLHARRRGRRRSGEHGQARPHRAGGRRAAAAAFDAL